MCVCCRAGSGVACVCLYLARMKAVYAVIGLGLLCVAVEAIKMQLPQCYQYADTQIVGKFSVNDPITTLYDDKVDKLHMLYDSLGIVDCDANMSKAAPSVCLSFHLFFFECTFLWSFAVLCCITFGVCLTRNRSCVRVPALGSLVAIQRI